MIKVRFTNYERIKNMSIEELATFIYVNFQTDDWCNPIVDGKTMFHEDDVVEWLESFESEGDIGEQNDR